MKKEWKQREKKSENRIEKRSEQKKDGKSDKRNQEIQKNPKPIKEQKIQKNRESNKGKESILSKAGKERKKELKKGSNKGSMVCPYAKKCGGCQYQGLSYEEQLAKKQKWVNGLMKRHCTVYPIQGMEEPYFYRNKVHAVLDRDRKNQIISGVYKEGTHIVVPIDRCLIEDQKADEIIGTIKELMKSFKMKVYDEDTQYGLMRHILVKRGFATGEVMVVLVTASPVFPSKNNFVKALRQKHPEITTVIQNINGRGTSMVLGDKEHVLYGKGYIEDVLCGCTFRISSKSFYQINPIQTEYLYEKAMELAGLSGKEKVIDAYCGIGTIGLIASKKAKEVIGVELNKDAVKDAIFNCKRNEIKNAKFYCEDASKFMVKMAENGQKADVVFLDPPRSGSTEVFIDSLAMMAPKKVVYISCHPETLERDIRYFKKKGYMPKGCYPFDLFPWTGHVENVVVLTKEK